MQEAGTKGTKDKARLGGKVDIVQEIEFWRYYQIV